MAALRYALLLAAALATAPALAQQAKPAEEKSAESMQFLRERLQADKKLVVLANMDLTEQEAKSFWPIYEMYQKDLHKLSDRLATLIAAYAREYNAKTLTDAKAARLLDQSLSLEEEEVKLKRTYAARLGKVLPGRKVARYMQLENKVRAIVRYEIADAVPLAH